MKLRLRLPLSTLLLLFPGLSSSSSDNPDSRGIQILNESGRRIDIHWIHPNTNELVLQSTPDVLAGASFALNSFVSHAFQVRELPGKKSGVCEGSEGECRVDYFTVNENQDQGEFRFGCLFDRFMKLFFCVIINFSTILARIFVFFCHFFKTLAGSLRFFY